MHALFGWPPLPTRYFLATLFTTSQEYASVLRLLGGMTEGMLPAEVRGLPRIFWTMIYPSAFWPEVLEQSKRVGLNPYLVLSGAPLASPEGYARRGCR